MLVCAAVLLVLAGSADGAVRRWFAAVAGKPFSAEAVRKAGRIFDSPQFVTRRSEDAVRVDANDGSCSVELGALRARAPQKVMMRCTFEGDREAVRFARDLVDMLEAALVPPLRFETGTWQVQQATYVRKRQLVGVELHVLPEGDRTAAAVVLIDRGPRIVMCVEGCPGTGQR
jgi:hypothetical protein